MYLTVGIRGLQVDEKVFVRAIAADPRSDWAHGYSSGPLYVTDRRLVLYPWTVLGGDRRPWELSLDVIERVSSAPVPVWLFGLVRIWLHGIRLVTVDGKGKTIIVGQARAAECVASLEGILTARRRSSGRTSATAST